MSNPPEGGYPQGSAPDWNQGWQPSANQPSANQPSANQPSASQPSATPPPSASQQSAAEYGHQGWDPNAQQQWGQQQNWDPNAQQQWGQQQNWDPNAQQQWGQQQNWDPNAQQQWGATSAQGSQWGNWEQPAQQQPRKKNLLPLIIGGIVLALVLGGVGIWALTKGGDDGEGGGGGGSKDDSCVTTIKKFYELASQDKPNSYQFDSIIADVGVMGIQEATQNAPGGQYEVVSTGDKAGGKIPVTIKHNGVELKGTHAVKDVDGECKLSKPFSSLAMTASDTTLEYKVNEINTFGLKVGEKKLFIPGVYTVTASAGFSGNKTPVWKPKSDKIQITPGASKDIALDPQPTDAWLKESKEAVTKAFTTCFAKSDFAPYDCPNSVDTPSDADFPYKVLWSITPADAPTNPKLVPGGIKKICYTIEGSVGYNYTNRDKKTVVVPPQQKSYQGCYTNDYGYAKVEWGQ